MSGGGFIAILIRAAMETALRHLPRWLARRGGEGQAERRIAVRERGLAKKLRTLGRILRRLR